MCNKKVCTILGYIRFYQMLLVPVMQTGALMAKWAFLGQFLLKNSGYLLGKIKFVYFAVNV